MSNLTDVTIWVPDRTVPSMEPVIADGTVDWVVDAVRRAYSSIADGNIPVMTYGQDFDEAIAAVVAYNGGNGNRRLRVVVGNLASGNRDHVKTLLADLYEDNGFVLIVATSHQGYDEAWAAELKQNDRVDVFEPKSLEDDKVAMGRIGRWIAQAM